MSVVGPASSTNKAIVRFDGTNGELIQGSVLVVTDAGNICLGSQNLLTVPKCDLGHCGT